MPMLPRSGQLLRVAPEVVVVELLRRGDLEAADLDALGVHAAHHVADRAVLARGVHRLEDHDDPVGVLGREPHPGTRRAARSPRARISFASWLDCLRWPAVSKSFGSRTRRPGSTRNGSMNSAIRFGLRSTMRTSSPSAVERDAGSPGESIEASTLSFMTRVPG